MQEEKVKNVEIESIFYKRWNKSYEIFLSNFNFIKIKEKIVEFHTNKTMIPLKKSFLTIKYKEA